MCAVFPGLVRNKSAKEIWRKKKKAKKKEFGYEVAAVQNGPYRSGETCLDFVWADDSFLSANVPWDDEP